MIDLDELERLLNRCKGEKMAHGLSDRMFEMGQAENRFADALRNAAPELIAMARRLEWIVEKAIEWDEVEHKAFLIELQTLRGPDVYAAISAAMQEKPCFTKP